MGTMLMNARADVVVSMDMDLSEAGIQSDTPAGNGQNLQVGIVMDITGSTQVSYYSFGIRLDDDELNYLSRVRTHWPLNVISEDPPVILTGSGDSKLGVTTNYLEIQGFDGATFANSATAGSYLVATLTLATDSLAGDASEIDVMLGFYNAPGTVDLFADQNDQVIAKVTFVGGSLTAVPEPSAFGAFAFTTCLLSCNFRRRALV